MKEPFEIMTDQEHYSLRWNNHQNHILRAFDTLLQTKTLVDVTLVCAETSIRAHKVVLSACSPFFQRVFSETPCKHPVIVLKDFRGWVVQAIVDFMYRGEISVPQERLSVLIQAGESLQVRGLVDHPVAGNTPTPAQSPEDFSLLESSLISPTSPSLPSPNFPPHSTGNLRHHHHHHHAATTTTTTTTSTPKMLLPPPQVFADPSISLPSAELCTSPMPRRKQARPRRRSGDCAPQDLSSKPTTPVPPSLEDDDEREGKAEEHEEDRVEDMIGDEEDIMEGLEEDDDDGEEDDEDEEEVEDDLKRILCRSQSVDEKLAAIVAKEDQLRAQSRGSDAAATAAAATSGDERRSRSLHKPSSGSRKSSSSTSCKGDRSLSKGGDVDALQTSSLTPSSSAGSSVSDGPENLCMKKSSPSRTNNNNNNQHPGVAPGAGSSIDGLTNSDHRHSPAAGGVRSSSRDGSTRLGGDTMKDASPLTDPGSVIGRGLLSLKDIRHLNRAALNRSLGSLSPPPSFASSLANNNNLHPALGLLSHHHLHHHHHNEAKRVKMEHRDEERALLAHDDMEPPHFLDHMDLALGTHQHPLAGHPHLSAHHHLRGSSPQLRPPPISALLEGLAPENNNSSSNSGGSGNSKKNNHNNSGGGGNFLNHHHHHHHHGNANSKHHHPHHGHGPPQHHHHPHLPQQQQQQQQQSTAATGSPGAPPNHLTGNGDGPGGPLSGSGNSSNNNNNTSSSNGGGNNGNSSGGSSKNNNNNNNNLHHPPHHPPHGGPKGSAGPGGGPKDFLHSPTLNFPPFFNHSADGPPRPPHSPLPFPHMPSVSSLTLTPPHMFGLDSPLGLFPPGMDPGKIYSPLMEMSDPRGLHHDGPPFLKKKMNRPKGQHSAPRGGPPRSWTNAELTEALQHVWNKKMTTSQASRIFGIPYNSLLMYVRGKYGKSLKLEQLRKDCISGPPIELLQMGVSNSSKEKKEPKDPDHHHHHHHPPGARDGGSGGPNGGNSSGGGGGGGPGGGGLGDLRGPRSASSEPELLSSPNPLFNPFPGGFYPDFPSGFPGLPLSMLNLLPPERHSQPHSLPLAMDEDCKSDRSKQSLDDDYPQPLALNRPASEQLTDNRREIYQQNGQD